MRALLGRGHSSCASDCIAGLYALLKQRRCANPKLSSQELDTQQLQALAIFDRQAGEFGDTGFDARDQRGFAQAEEHAVTAAMHGHPSRVLRRGN